MADERYVQILANPVSGRRSSRALVAALAKRIEVGGWAARVHLTSGPGDGARVAAACDPGACRAMVVVGGDGTVRETATAVQSAVPIVILPMGTENLVAKYLEMECSVESAWGRLREGRPVAVDIAEMRREAAGSKGFLLVAGMGFDAEVVRRVTASRGGFITHLDYFWPIWRTFWSYRHPRLRVETAEGLFFEGPGMVFVGNIPRYAIGLRLLHSADPRDGLLDVCVFECGNRRALLRHAVNTLLRRQAGTAGVHYGQTTRVRVSADRAVDVELDGDLADPLPAEYCMTGRQVTFLVSPGWRAMVGGGGQ